MLPRAELIAGAKTALPGISDDQQRLCLSLALWNGSDPFLKERFFGLTNHEGNHGEDVKEVYYYLDATPTHSYLKMLYKYPQRAVPVRPTARREPPPWQAGAGVRVVRHGRIRRRPLLRCLRRVRQGRSGRYSDAGYRAQSRSGAGPAARSSAVVVPQYVVMGLRLRNAGAPCTGRRFDSGASRSSWATTGCLRRAVRSSCFATTRPTSARLYGQPDARGYFKDALHEYVVHGNREAVNPARTGTKAAAHYAFEVPAGGERADSLAAHQKPQQPAFCRFRRGV